MCQLDGAWPKRHTTQPEIFALRNCSTLHIWWPPPVSTMPDTQPSIPPFCSTKSVRSRRADMTTSHHIPCGAPELGINVSHMISGITLSLPSSTTTVNERLFLVQPVVSEPRPTLMTAKLTRVLNHLQVLTELWKLQRICLNKQASRSLCIPREYDARGAGAPIYSYHRAGRRRWFGLVSDKCGLWPSWAWCEREL
jgi:hypothetical protein